MQQAIDILDATINAVEQDKSKPVDDDKEDEKVEEKAVEFCDADYMKKVWGKYESIPNTNKQQTIDYLVEEGHTKDDIIWVASEKVHGSNFSLITNGRDIMAGSRTQILDDKTKFFGGWRPVMEAEKERVLKAFKALNKKYNNQIKVAIIYGELFGGCYQHPEKKYMPKNVKCIQKGVYYSPEVKFYAFDIKTDLYSNQKTDDTKEDEDDEIDGRLPVNEANEIFEECGFLYAKPLKQGTFQELLKFEVDTFQSTLPKELGLPAPMQGKTEIVNIAEGIVIRKMCDKVHRLLKIKSKKFVEIEARAEERGKKKKEKKGNKGNKSNNLEEQLEKKKQLILKFVNEEFVDLILRCVTESRFEAAVSKIGEFGSDTAKQIQKELNADVLQELKELKPDIMGNLKKPEEGKLRGFISIAIEIFMKPKKDALQ